MGLHRFCYSLTANRADVVRDHEFRHSAFAVRCATELTNLWLALLLGMRQVVLTPVGLGLLKTCPGKGIRLAVAMMRSPLRFSLLANATVAPEDA